MDREPVAAPRRQPSSVCVFLLLGPIPGGRSRRDAIE
jgi:hypothetical protein